MYVAVKGGAEAIDQAHALLAEARRGDPGIAELSIEQIRQQLSLAVARVMAEGALYDEFLAALAIKQARGDLPEAIFLLRAYRTTLPRIGNTEPLSTSGMRVVRRISAVYKDVPGGQILGPTFDYTHRLLDFSLADDPEHRPAMEPRAADKCAVAGVDGEPSTATARVLDQLLAEGLMQEPEFRDPREPPQDLTRQPMDLPAPRDLRLQNLSRGDEGFLLALGYSTQRGYGNNHPFVGELRYGHVGVEIHCEELGFAVGIGEIEVTECEMINQFRGSADSPPQFTRGYGLVFGHNERKAMSMALVDRALRGAELGETPGSPAEDAEFVLYHSDSVEAAGFVQHLKLPHYVDFQSELELIRRLRGSRTGGSGDAEGGEA